MDPIGSGSATDMSSGVGQGKTGNPVSNLVEGLLNSISGKQSGADSSNPLSSIIKGLAGGL